MTNQEMLKLILEKVTWIEKHMKDNEKALDKAVNKFADDMKKESAGKC